MTEPTKQTRKTMEAVLDWLVEYSFALELAVYSLGFTAALVGGLALIANRESNRRQERTILELRNDNIEAQRSLEAEKVNRLELEKQVKSRHVDVAPLAVGVGQYPNTKASIIHVDDSEALNTANSIFLGLTAAGWEVGHPEKTDERLLTGVIAATGTATKAQDALLSALQKQGLKAESGDQIPGDSILIEVGLNDRWHWEGIAIMRGGPEGAVQYRHKLNAPAVPKNDDK
jgi:hypothetical protein